MSNGLFYLKEIVLFKVVKKHLKKNLCDDQ